MGLQVNSGEQWVVIRAEHSGASIQRMLVETAHPGLANDPVAVLHEDVVKYQAGQGVERMAPGRSRGWYFESEAAIPEQAPGRLVAASAQIQIGAEYHGVVRNRGDKVASLKLSARGAKPLRARGPARIQMSTDQPERMASQGQSSRDRDPALMMGVVLIVGTFTLVASILADFAYSVVDPRIRYVRAR